ncbi:Uncharacterized protein PBTT_07873 [Plasmodiophora brassicae]
MSNGAHRPTSGVAHWEAVHRQWIGADADGTSDCSWETVQRGRRPSVPAAVTTSFTERRMKLADVVKVLYESWSRAQNTRFSSDSSDNTQANADPRDTTKVDGRWSNRWTT